MITSFGSTYQGNGDGYIIMLSPRGSYLWRQQLGATQFDATDTVLTRNSSGTFPEGTTYGTLGSTNSGGADAHLRRLEAPTALPSGPMN